MNATHGWALAGILIAVSPLSAADSLQGRFTAISNYVWRGFTMSDDAPSIIGGFDYQHNDGWFAKAEVAGVRVEERPEQLALLWAGVAKPWRDWVLDAGVVAYEYTRGDRYDPATGLLAPGSANKNDFAEVFLGARMGRARFRYYRSEDYIGTGRLSNYFDLNYTVPLENQAELLQHYGFTDSSAIIDHAGQLSDTSFGLTSGPLSFTITNLDDNEDGHQSRNPRFVISWQVATELLR